MSLLEDGRKSFAAQGQRIRLLRKIAKANLLPFAEKAEVNKNTLSCWEKGELARPLLPKNIEKLITAFKHYDIEVGERWIRAGEGEPPKHKGNTINFENIYLPLTMEHAVIENSQEVTGKNEETSTIELSKSLLDEMQIFSSIKNAVVTKIDHESFAPIIEKGDWVGGIWQDSSILMDEKICIIELQPGLLHVAKVAKGTKKGLFHLTYINQKPLKHIQTQDITLSRIAPVIRFWR